ncbi:MAG: hypothetical protein RL611_866, partial [Actinomycetota bacterium]
MSAPHRSLFRANAALVAIVAISATSVFGATRVLAAPTSNPSASSTSINTQPISKLKSGGSLLLPISQEPRQFNPFHIAANDFELSRMMSATLPSFFISDSQGKL